MSQIQWDESYLHPEILDAGRPAAGWNNNNNDNNNNNNNDNNISQPGSQDHVSLPVGNNRPASPETCLKEFPTELQQELDLIFPEMKWKKE